MSITNNILLAPQVIDSWRKLILFTIAKYPEYLNQPELIPNAEFNFLENGSLKIFTILPSGEEISLEISSDLWQLNTQFLEDLEDKYNGH